MARIVVLAAELTAIVARTRAAAGIRWGGPADREALVAAGAGTAMVEAALGQKAVARVAVAEEAGRIAGWNFYVCAGSVRVYSWLEIELAAGRDVFAMGSYVLPEHRGRHLLADIKGFAARSLVEGGLDRMFSVVETGNAASLRAHARVGAVPLATLTRVRIGGLDLVWTGRSPGRLHRGPPPYVFSAPASRGAG